MLFQFFLSKVGSPISPTPLPYFSADPGGRACLAPRARTRLLRVMAHRFGRVTRALSAWNLDPSEAGSPLPGQSPPSRARNPRGARAARARTAAAGLEAQEALTAGKRPGRTEARGAPARRPPGGPRAARGPRLWLGARAHRAIGPGPPLGGFRFRFPADIVEENESGRGLRWRGCHRARGAERGGGGSPGREPGAGAQPAPGEVSAAPSRSPRGLLLADPAGGAPGRRRPPRAGRARTYRAGLGDGGAPARGPRTRQPGVGWDVARRATAPRTRSRSVEHRAPFPLQPGFPKWKQDDGSLSGAGRSASPELSGRKARTLAFSPPAHSVSLGP